MSAKSESKSVYGSSHKPPTTGDGGDYVLVPRAFVEAMEWIGDGRPEFDSTHKANWARAEKAREALRLLASAPQEGGWPTEEMVSRVLELFQKPTAKQVRAALLAALPGPVK